jgi:hypothetical protein
VTIIRSIVLIFQLTLGKGCQNEKGHFAYAFLSIMNGGGLGAQPLLVFFTNKPTDDAAQMAKIF